MIKSAILGASIVIASGQEWDRFAGQMDQNQQMQGYGMNEMQEVPQPLEYGMDQGETYMPNAAWKRGYQSGYQSGYQDAKPAETPDLAALLKVVNELTESLKNKA